MPEATPYIKLKTLEDLIYFVALSPSPFIQYIDLEGKHVYFVNTMAIFGPSMVYYVETKERLPNKYIVFNRYQDKITYSNQLGTDPQAVYIPILQVEKTSLFLKYPPT